MLLRKNYTEKTVYKPSNDVTFTVTNQPDIEKNKVVGYKTNISITTKTRQNTKLIFLENEDIKKFLNKLDVSEKQKKLL